MTGTRLVRCFSTFVHTGCSSPLLQLHSRSFGAVFVPTRWGKHPGNVEEQPFGAEVVSPHVVQLALNELELRTALLVLIAVVATTDLLDELLQVNIMSLQDFTQFRCPRLLGMALKANGRVEVGARGLQPLAMAVTNLVLDFLGDGAEQFVGLVHGVLLGSCWKVLISELLMLGVVYSNIYILSSTIYDLVPI